MVENTNCIELDNMISIKDSFTNIENRYFDKLLQLMEIDEEKISDKRDKRLTVDYRNFIYNILKYRNLKLEESGTICRRLIKANRYLDLNLLEKDNYNLIRFSGIYVVSDVIFLEPEVYYNYYNNQETPAQFSSNNICFRSIHLVTDSNNRSMAVALMKSDLSEKYLTTYKSWSYPMF